MSTTFTTKRLKTSSKTKIMLNKTIFSGILLMLLTCVGARAQAVEKNPVIIIPGFSGTEMVDAAGKTIWFT